MGPVSLAVRGRRWGGGRGRGLGVGGVKGGVVLQDDVVPARGNAQKVAGEGAALVVGCSSYSGSSYSDVCRRCCQPVVVVVVGGVSLLFSSCFFLFFTVLLVGDALSPAECRCGGGRVGGGGVVVGGGGGRLTARIESRAAVPVGGGEGGGAAGGRGRAQDAGESTLFLKMSFFFLWKKKRNPTAQLSTF